MARSRTCRIPMQLLPIEGDGYHIAVKARVNGRVAYMLVDTGASRTVFDTERIKRFFKEDAPGLTKNPQLSAGLGTTTFESHTTVLKSFALGDFKTKPFPTILLDLSNINQSYALIGLKPIDGVIGSDLLVQLKAGISFQHSIITIRI